MLAVCFVLSGCGGNETADPADTQAEADQSLQQVLDNDELIVGLDIAFPPMGFQNENNEIVGFDVDLAKRLAKSMA